MAASSCQERSGSITYDIERGRREAIAAKLHSLGVLNFFSEFTANIYNVCQDCSKYDVVATTHVF